MFRTVNQALRPYPQYLTIVTGTQGGDKSGHSTYHALVLRAERRIGRGAWYAGRPVLVTANDYGVGLFNGDLGVMGWAGSDMVVYFPDGKGSVRAVAPARLPPHETAWAMTVHKSQGSEFNRVVLVLPEADTPLVNRALLYTAATRAKEKLTVIGPEAVLRQGTMREARRPSGLGAVLQTVLSLKAV